MKKFAGRPFVLLGVNSDPDRESLKKVLVDEKITWPNWWDEGKTTGPIHQLWQIKQRPGIHILDAKGVIRHRNIAPEKVDDAIAVLLNETKQP